MRTYAIPYSNATKRNKSSKNPRSRKSVSERHLLHTSSIYVFLLLLLLLDVSLSFDLWAERDPALRFLCIFFCAIIYPRFAPREGAPFSSATLFTVFPFPSFQSFMGDRVRCILYLRPRNEATKVRGVHLLGSLLLKFRAQSAKTGGLFYTPRCVIYVAPICLLIFPLVKFPPASYC